MLLNSHFASVPHRMSSKENDEGPVLRVASNKIVETRNQRQEANKRRSKGRENNVTLVGRARAATATTTTAIIVIKLMTIIIIL